MVSQPLTNGPKKKPLTGLPVLLRLPQRGRYTSSGVVGGLASVSHLAVTQAQVRYLRRGEEGRGNKRCFSSCSSCVRTLGRAVRSSDGGRRVDLCSSQAAIRHRQVREGGGGEERGKRRMKDGERQKSRFREGKHTHAHSNSLINDIV